MTNGVLPVLARLPQFSGDSWIGPAKSILRTNARHRTPKGSMMQEPRSIKRFAAEGLVIVLSILIAFWIDAWWDGRQEAEQEAGVLEALHEEADRNRLELELFIARTERDLDRVDRFFRASPADLPRLPEDSTNVWLRATMVPWTFDPDLTASAVLLSRPHPRSRRASEIRPIVAEWTRLIEDADEEKAALTQLGNHLLGRVAVHTVETVDAGLAALDVMASRLGPPLLRDLRLDSGYVAAVSEKTHQQAVYLEELKAASALLDSLIAELRRSGG